MERHSGTEASVTHVTHIAYNETRQDDTTEEEPSATVTLTLLRSDQLTNRSAHAAEPPDEDTESKPVIEKQQAS